MFLLLSLLFSSVTYIWLYDGDQAFDAKCMCTHFIGTHQFSKSDDWRKKITPSTLAITFKYVYPWIDRIHVQCDKHATFSRIFFTINVHKSRSDNKTKLIFVLKQSHFNLLNGLHLWSRFYVHFLFIQSCIPMCAL